MWIEEQSVCGANVIVGAKFLRTLARDWRATAERSKRGVGGHFNLVMRLPVPRCDMDAHIGGHRPFRWGRAARSEQHPGTWTLTRADRTRRGLSLSRRR